MFGIPHPAQPMSYINDLQRNCQKSETIGKSNQEPLLVDLKARKDFGPEQGVLQGFGLETARFRATLLAVPLSLHSTLGVGGGDRGPHLVWVAVVAGWGVNSHPDEDYAPPPCPPSQKCGPQPHNLVLLLSCSCALQKGWVFLEDWGIHGKTPGRSNYGKQVLLLAGWGQVTPHSLVMADPQQHRSYGRFIKVLLYRADIVQDTCSFCCCSNMFLPPKNANLCFVLWSL